MAIASVIVEIEGGASEAVLARLAHLPAISVYGLSENQIVTVVEGETASDVERVLKDVQVLEDVIGVYPVFFGEDE